MISTRFPSSYSGQWKRCSIPTMTEHGRLNVCLAHYAKPAYRIHLTVPSPIYNIYSLNKTLNEMPNLSRISNDEGDWSIWFYFTSPKPLEPIRIMVKAWKV